MARKKQTVLQGIVLDKLVHGGQCLAKAADGKKILVWGGLPNEVVNVLITKKRKSFLEGVVTDVIKADESRIEPEEPGSYLSTSPWQIMAYKLENDAKQAILTEAFRREGLGDVEFEPFVFGDQQYNYRNKQEYGFWGDDDGLHIAHYIRGSHGKQKVQGSTLADESINIAARAVRDELNRLKVWGGKIKTLVLRNSEAKEVVGALFVKETLDFDDFELPKELKGLDIYQSDPKSPASVPTEKIYSFGDIKLMDRVGGVNIIYDVMSFFQVNLPVFELALDEVKTIIVNFLALQKKLPDMKVVDFYSGVGTIGLVVGATTLVESEELNVNMAKKNIGDKSIEVVCATSETALDYIKSGSVLIVDPPRAGLHKDVVERITDAKPLLVVYLSCNPSTQARDIAKLCRDHYKVLYAGGYNFFPRTPHIESLVVLELK